MSQASQFFLWHTETVLKTIPWMILTFFSLWGSNNSFRHKHKGTCQPYRYTSMNTVKFAGSDGPRVFTFCLQEPLHSMWKILGMAQMQHLQCLSLVSRRWSAHWGSWASIKPQQAEQCPGLYGQGFCKCLYICTKPSPFSSYYLLDVRSALGIIKLREKKKFSSLVLV